VDRRRARARTPPRVRRRRRARAPLSPGAITVVLLARDEARRLPDFFAALPPDVHVFVLDAESHDETAAIARAHGAQVERRPWEGFVAARRHALAQVRTPWTLMLDADERLDATLRAAIAAASADLAGYRLHRTTLLCGAAVRTAGWSSELLLRLFRTERARLEAHSVGGGADLHERWVVDGPTGVLPGTVVHDSYPTLASYRAKFARYTRLEAASLRPSRLALARELLAFPVRVLWSIARYGGWRDGWRGLFVAWESARYRVVVRLGALRRE
jgi:glycosyltransferase involved in cell wall biosynthesis